MNAFIKLKNKFLTATYSNILTAAFRIKVYYEDPQQKKTRPQAIYICNHMSHYDGLVMRAVFRKINLYSLVAGDWFDKKWAKTFLFYENSIPVDRDNPGTKWLHDAREVLKNGDSINIFPEGHTSKSDKIMDDFKPGFLLLASMCRNVPIIPVATIGNYKWFFGERKKVMVGKPVYFDKSKFSLDPEKLDNYANEFRDIIQEMKNQLWEMNK